MKKYSQYFKNMMTTSVVFLILFIPCMISNSPTLGAITIVMSFIFWFVGVMSPDHEKYKEGR